MTSTPLAKLIEIWTAWETESDSCDSSPTEILAVAGILRTPRQHFKGYREAPSEVSITALVVVSICIQYFKLLQACYLNHCDVTVSYVCNSQTWWYFWVAHLPNKYRDWANFDSVILSYDLYWRGMEAISTSVPSDPGGWVEYTLELLCGL